MFNVCDKETLILLASVFMTHCRRKAVPYK